MKVIALETAVAGVTDEQFTRKLLEAEAEEAWDLYQSGVLREFYFREDRPEAVLILEAGSAEEASSYLEELPLVRAGLIDFEIIPLIPYDGFERLFRRTPDDPA